MQRNTSFTKLCLWFLGAQSATSMGKRLQSKSYIAVGHDATPKSTNCQRTLRMMVLADDESRQERLRETRCLVRTHRCHISGAGAAQTSTRCGVSRTCPGWSGNRDVKISSNHCLYYIDQAFQPWLFMVHQAAWARQGNVAANVWY